MKTGKRENGKTGQKTLKQIIRGNVCEIMLDGDGYQSVYCNGEFSFTLPKGSIPITFTVDVLYSILSILAEEANGEVEKFMIKRLKEGKHDS